MISNHWTNQRGRRGLTLRQLITAYDTATSLEDRVERQLRIRKKLLKLATILALKEAKGRFSGAEVLYVANGAGYDAFAALDAYDRKDISFRYFADIITPSVLARYKELTEDPGLRDLINEDESEYDWQNDPGPTGQAMRTLQGIVREDQ